MHEAYGVVCKGKLLSEALSAHSGVKQGYILSSLRDDFDLGIVINSYQKNQERLGMYFFIGYVSA
jgi:hypothetical protein